MDKLVIGQEEWCRLPEVGVQAVCMRVDSGAQTSSLHATNITPVTVDDADYVRFNVLCFENGKEVEKQCCYPVHKVTKIKSSNGESETRYVIQVYMDLAVGFGWDILLTLTDRSSMTYPMLLGREAMMGRIVIDPEHSFLLGDLESRSQI